MIISSRKQFSKAPQLMALLIVVSAAAFGQQVTIPVETRNHAILLQTDKENHLRMVYNGAPLADKKEYAAVAAQYDLNDENSAGIYNNAYSTAGTYSLTEPAMQVMHADGNASAGSEIYKPCQH